MTLRRTCRYLAVIVTAVLALAVGYLLALFDSGNSMVAPALVGGAFAVAISFLSPRFGFYALLFSAMFGRVELPVGGVSLRPDQLSLLPVLVGVALRLALEPPHVLSGFGRRSWVPVFAFSGLGLYVAVNALASFLYAPQPTQSLKIVAWLLLSFLAFTVAYSIIGRYVGVREAFFAVLGAGFFSAAVGIVLFLLFFLAGSSFGIQQDPGARIYGTFFEANIFGSFQAFTAAAGVAVLQLEQTRGSAFRWVAAGTILSVVALALSFTRAAWLGFLVGLLILALFRLRGGDFLVLLFRSVTLTFIALLALIPTGLLENLATRFVSIADLTGGTFAFRLVRFEIALYEWPASPILGLGTNSFGQRHLDPTQNYAPDYLPNLFIATLYDTGLVGLLILLAAFGVVLWALARVAVGSDKEEGALALALLCGAIGLLVSYQATNAFWFSYNWIILAMAVRLYQSWREAQTASSGARAYGAAHR